MESYLMQVSDPSSPIYGKYLTMEEVHAFTSPSPKSVNAVLSWLRSEGINGYMSLGGDFIQAEIPVSSAKRLFNTESFHEFHHEKKGHVIHRSTDAFALPAEISSHVDFLSGVYNLPSMISTTPHMSPRFVSFDSEAALVDAPADLPTLLATYKIKEATKINAKSSTGLVEALGQEFSPSDLTSFLKKYGAPSQSVKQVFGINNPNACVSNPNDCVEANLDVQVVLGVAQNIPLIYYSIPANDQDPFYTWMVELGQNSNPPLVNSVSYGGIENDSSQASNNNRVNQEFIKAGTRGVTIVVASGDDGVANFIARTDKSQCGFNPSFPASSPYVLSVGATQFKGGVKGAAEISQLSSNSPSGGITTGGGFSAQFARPSYQDVAVNNYLNIGNLPKVPTTSTNYPSKGFNIKGRGYPDVAGLGHNYPVAIAGNFYNVDGTSASSPLVAAMIGLVNNERLNAGKAPLGFVNPLVYSLAQSHPEIFTDVTVGTNNCAASSSPQVCCTYGFTAAQGWDPLTGLGTINYTLFLAQAVQA
jgi:subtilase family serine protease